MVQGLWFEMNFVLRWISLLYLIIFELVVHIDLGFLKFNLKKCLIMVFLVKGYVMIGCCENWDRLGEEKSLGVDHEWVLGNLNKLLINFNKLWFICMYYWCNNVWENNDYYYLWIWFCMSFYGIVWFLMFMG